MQDKVRSSGTKVNTGGVVSMTVSVSTRDTAFRHSSVATWVMFNVHWPPTHTESTVDM